MSDLHPWAENPRTISPERFENLRRAIAADPEFLRLRPVLARTDGLIYCGNQRYLAAVANGATTVPAILEDVDERTMRERAIRDNEQWGEWSDGLALVLRSLEGAGSDLSLLGLEDDHLHVGGHSGDFAERLRERRKGPPAFRGDRESELAPLLGAAFPQVDRYLRSGAPLYIAAPHSPDQFAVFIAAATAVGWHLSQTLVWVKNTFVPALQDYSLAPTSRSVSRDSHPGTARRTRPRGADTHRARRTPRHRAEAPA